VFFLILLEDIGNWLVVFY